MSDFWKGIIAVAWTASVLVFLRAYGETDAPVAFLATILGIGVSMVAMSTLICIFLFRSRQLALGILSALPVGVMALALS